MAQLPEAPLPTPGSIQELAQTQDTNLAVAQVNLQLMAHELRSEAMRIAGLDGLAQADALLDIAADPDFSHSVWPLDEMISLLEAGDDATGRCDEIRRKLLAIAQSLEEAVPRRAPVSGRECMSRAA